MTGKQEQLLSVMSLLMHLVFPSPGASTGESSILCAATATERLRVGAVNYV